MPFLPILAFFLDDETLVSAAKADDLKEKHPELADEIDALVEADPTPQKKYLQWSVGQLQAGAAVEDIIEAVKEYDKALPRLQGKDKDIGSFKTLADMQAVVEKAAAVETKGDVRKKAKKGGVILHEDDRWMLVRPDTQEASIYYGSNTAWCVSRRDLKENYWYHYTGDNNVRFYFLIDKQAKPRTADDKGHHFSKVAMMIKKQKPYASEPFQDAANKMPSPFVVEDVIGPVFNEMHDLALEDSKKLPKNTWVYDLFNEESLSSDDFLKIYDEHIDEIKDFNEENKQKIEELLIYLLEDKNIRVEEMFLDYCRSLAKNTRYAILSGVESPETKIINAVRRGLMSKETAQEVLDIFSKSANEHLREQVARQKQLTKEVVQRLLSDRSSLVQRTMLGNPIMMQDPELTKLAVEKASDAFTSGTAWSGLVTNRALPMDLFEKLTAQPPLVRHEAYHDMIEKMLGRIEVSALSKALGDEDSKAELEDLEKRVAALLEIPSRGPTDKVSNDISPELAAKIVAGKSTSALSKLFSKLKDENVSGCSARRLFYRQTLLIDMAENAYIPVDVQEGILNIDNEDLLGDGLNSSVLYALARNKGIATSTINDILAKALNLLMNKVIDIKHKDKVSYHSIILALSRNEAIRHQNARFLDKYIEDHKSSFTEEDLAPNSDFDRANSPILNAFYPETFYPET
jgi:hypothetical protein